MTRPVTHAWSRVGLMLLAIGVFATLPRNTAAQEDFRSADLDRPIRVEDAVPIKYREWEFEVGTRGLIAEGGSGLLGLVELKAGLFRNVQIGIELEGGFEGESGGATVGGVEAGTVHALFGITRETPALPALALRIDGSSPGAGGLGHDDWQLGAKGILSRSFGRARLHANAGYTAAASTDGGDYWRGGLGFDYPLGLFSRAILADIYAEIPVSVGRSRVWIEVGTRLQTTNWSVLDLGFATRLDLWEQGNANVELVVGLSRVFGIPGFGRVAPYPDPTIP